MTFDAIRAVEACYAASEDPGWLRGLVDAVDMLGRMPCAFGQVLRTSQGRPRIVLAVATGAFAPALPAINEESERFARAAPVDVLRRAWAAIPPVDYAVRRAARIGPAALEYQRSVLQRAGERDAVLVLGDDETGTTVVLARGVDGGGCVSARTWHQLTRFASHVGAGLRLRRALLGHGGPGAADRAAKGPDADGARAEPGRSLTDAARRGSRAAGLLRRADPDEALQVWQGLVDGRWSLVDRCDSPGRRCLLVRRNDPEARDPRALTAREAAVLAHAALGRQNKAIGFEVGLSPSAVASHLAAAQRKLRLTSRAELIRLFGALFSAGGER